MPVFFDFKPEYNLVVCRQVGTVDDEEFLASYHSLFEGDRFDPSMALVVDLRRADSSKRSREAIQAFARYWKEWMQKTGKKSRVAVIAPKDVSFGLARMYEAYAESANISFTVFREADAALEWLGIPEDALK
ncbi:MAG: hypothetical protein JXR49_03710 [Acidobacteria bacterium]|nr:hypothetical protein [Acidobacteriota bacterium]